MEVQQKEMKSTMGDNKSMEAQKVQMKAKEDSNQPQVRKYDIKDILVICGLFGIGSWLSILQAKSGWTFTLFALTTFYLYLFTQFTKGRRRRRRRSGGGGSRRGSIPFTIKSSISNNFRFLDSVFIRFMSLEPWMLAKVDQWWEISSSLSALDKKHFRGSIPFTMNSSVSNCFRSLETLMLARIYQRWKISLSSLERLLVRLLVAETILLVIMSCTLLVKVVLFAVVMWCTLMFKVVLFAVVMQVMWCVISRPL